MTQYKYASTYDAKHMARAVARSLPISTKQSVNVCAFVRSKSLARVRRELAEVMALKLAVPFKRYNRDTPHQKGNGAAGRYPAKVCEHVLTILASAEANAREKGLNPDALVVKSILAHKAGNQRKGGRHRGRTTRVTHLEVVLTEGSAPSKKKYGKKKPAKKVTPKAEPTPAKKAEAPKSEEAPAEKKTDIPKEEPKGETTQ